MTDLLKTNPIALRHFILYEVLQGTPIEKAYPNFCNAVGEDVMEYREFEFWFYRFVNGEYDLNYQRDEDQKVYELLDMPIDIMKNIVEYLGIIDRIALSKTSRSLQTFIEDQKVFQYALTLESDSDVSIITLHGERTVTYIKSTDGCVKHCNKSEKLIRDVPHWKQALQDFKCILKNPKLHLDTLEINYFMSTKYFLSDESPPDWMKVANELEEALTFTHQLNVRNLTIESYFLEPALIILPSFKPGYLTTINIYTKQSNLHVLEKIAKLKQWKQAAYLTTNMTFFMSRLQLYYHFKEFSVAVRELSVEDIREMKETLFKSPNFKKCSVTCGNYLHESDMKQEFGDAIPGNKYIYQCPIPNSTEYFEIKREDYWDLKIERKKI